MSPRRSISIGVVGASGRMGHLLIRRLASEPKRYRVAGAWARAKSSAIGKDAGELAGVAALGVTITALEAADLRGGQIMIDFSRPAGTVQAAKLASRTGIAFLTGTTGLGKSAEAALDAAARRIPVLAASNFAPGVAVLAELVHLAHARLGPDYDVEIFEMHHRAKRDAPSGTARMLGAVLGDAEGLPRTSPRHGHELGYASARGGSVIGDHTVFFLGEHERLELTHRAQDRELFAQGALAAAEWLVGQEAGRYTLQQFLAARDG